MCRRPRRAVLIAAFAAICVLAGCTTTPTVHPQPVAVPPALRSEVVPSLSTRSMARLEHYNRMAGHAFADEHPLGSEMLVTNRAPGASVAQLLRLRDPMGAPEAPADGIDPVVSAAWEPRHAPSRFSPRPLLTLLHGGPESQAKLGWRGRYNHVVEEMGLALLEPHVHGSSGCGKTFVSLDDGLLHEDAVMDMGSGIDWIATQPRLDAARVLVMGGSHGGYMALAAAKRLADRIDGAVSVVGIGDFVSFLENTESDRRDLRRVEYDDEREPAMRAFLKGISPLSHVDKITKPLMIVQGRNDPRVPWTESEQIVRSLQARRTPLWYLLAANEGHGFARRENADFQFAALLRFTEETLRP